MCFSAGASFGASAVLGTIGVIALVKAERGPPRLFATIPLLFAIQQFAEGMLWISINNNGFENLQPVFLYTFLVFAMMVWPLWIPLTTRVLEKEPGIKKMLNILVSLGAVIFAGIGVIFYLYPVTVVATHHHLHYEFTFPLLTRKFIWLFTILYCMTTILPTFISSNKRMKWLGLGFLVSYFVAFAFYNGFVVSVWCYFAALLSGIVVWILSVRKKVSLL